LTRIENEGIIPAAMSTRIQRALFILLLAAVVPLQGYAAASTAICRALAHEDAPVGAVMAQHAHHGDAYASADHDMHGTPDGSSPHGSQHCVACSSCGVAAAISAFATIYVSDAPAWGVAIASFSAPKGHVPEGLDRPPLSLHV
jgi:hypothetical protein